MRRVVPSEEGGEEEGDEEEEGGEEGQVCSIIYCIWAALCELLLCTVAHDVSIPFSNILCSRERRNVYISAL